ncbi:hypothetical protein JB92DRAFT_3099119 [Gautieria morchelliformis]|nr:hypothetical protein JB92DRAFT_3099119 [Gautieria morchelliformis]
MMGMAWLGLKAVALAWLALALACAVRVTTTQVYASQGIKLLQECVLRHEERRGDMWIDSSVWTRGYGGPEAAVAEMLVYRMGRDVGKKDIWKIYEDAAQPLAPPWINAPRARALSRIRGYWIKV